MCQSTDAISCTHMPSASRQNSFCADASPKQLQNLVSPLISASHLLNWQPICGSRLGGLALVSCKRSAILMMAVRPQSSDCYAACTQCYHQQTTPICSAQACKQAVPQMQQAISRQKIIRPIQHSQPSSVDDTLVYSGSHPLMSALSRIAIRPHWQACQ